MLIFIIDRRPMFFEGEAVGFHHFWCFQALMGYIRVKGCQSCGQGFTDLQGGFIRHSTWGSNRDGKAVTEFVWLMPFISLFKGLEVRPTVATDSSCSGRNRHSGNTANCQRCKVITARIFKRNLYNVSHLRVR